MRKKFKTILLICSLALNGVCIVLFVLAASGGTAVISVAAMDLTAAAVAGAPRGGTVVFNTVEITIRRGETASLQFSVLNGNKQANRLITPLYDRAL